MPFPPATVRQVVNLLVQYGEVRGRPSIGITVGAIPENASSQYDLPDRALCLRRRRASDAEAKGILPGDIITAVNGEPVIDQRYPHRQEHPLGGRQHHIHHLARRGDL